jgi:pyruvate/2-oxoglutarate dehydrogenase complex dihydrolipoamide dehydrogenase (E3) component
MKSFDAIVIGAGQAGPSLTGRLTAAGMTVAMIEQDLFGGTCVNTGCTPTKTLVASARVAHQARRAAEYGVKLEGSVSIDMHAVRARKDTVVQRSRTNLETWLRGMERCTVIQGHARFESPHEVRIGDDVITAKRIFINVGCRALVPDMPGVDRVPYLTNTSILELDIVPRHLVIVGGSYIGLEFGQMYRRFGSEVTVIEMKPRLISREDPDVSTAIQEIFETEGITIRTEAECIRFEPRQQDIAAGVNCKAGEPEVIGSHVLLAVGRRPNTDCLGVEKAGIEVDKHGYIAVDEQLRTNVPGIWALGDCNGKGAFTHTAYNDFEIVAANLLDSDSRRVADRITDYALYVDPPLGRAGLTEEEVRRTGKPALIAIRPMSRVGRAVEKGETEGFIKVLVDAQSKQILGASFLGTGCDEVIHGILDVMYAKAPYTMLQRTVPIHPTVSELVPTLLGDLQPL